ncbi:YqgE/AlgH family protein [Stigmatella erecta]|nr:YqgE/AlgH family protein [Stigmatella erecta]
MKTLAPGLLMAMPQLGDPNFHRSVVLMLEHGEGGSMGLVINRGAPLTLGELARGQSMKIASGRTQQPVFVGGPVEAHRGFLLHDEEAVQEKHLILPGLFLSVTLDALSLLLESPAARLRFCLGYAGWGPGQLEREMAAGSWLFAEAAVDAVLEGDASRLWGDTLRGMGVDPAMLMVGKGLN